MWARETGAADAGDMVAIPRDTDSTDGGEVMREREQVVEEGGDLMWAGE